MADTNADWRIIGTDNVVVKATRHESGAVLRVTLYSNATPDPDGTEVPVIRYGATFQTLSGTAPCHGRIGEAVLKAFGLKGRARLGSAKPMFMDWGGEIKRPCGTEWPRGSGSLVWH